MWSLDGIRSLRSNFEISYMGSGDFSARHQGLKSGVGCEISIPQICTT